MAGFYGLPYIGHVSGGVRPGTQIVINGDVPRRFAREGFHVDLVCGDIVNLEHRRVANVAFAIATQFGRDERMFFNSKINGKWGVEQRHYIMPFKKGTSFEIVITVEENSYRVMIDGVSYGDYPSKVPYKDVGLLYIDGQVRIRVIAFRQLGGQPTPPLPAQVPPMAPGQYYQPMVQPQSMSYAPPPTNFVQSHFVVPQTTFAPTPMPSYQAPAAVHATAPVYPPLPAVPVPQPRYFEGQPPAQNPYHQERQYFQS